MVRIGKPIEVENRLVDLEKGWGWGVTGNGVRVSFGGNESVLGLETFWNHIVVMVVQLCEYSKNQ